jgi:hypothetical protein
MSFRETLIKELERAFPRAFSSEPHEPGAAATFPPKHPIVGEAGVWEEENGVAIGVGSITHFHIDAEGGDLSIPGAEERLAREVVAWLRDLFSDNVLLWRSRKYRGLGGHRRHSDDAFWSLMGPEDETFRWSGPVENPLRRSNG